MRVFTNEYKVKIQELLEFKFEIMKRRNQHRLLIIIYTKVEEIVEGHGLRERKNTWFQ